MTKTNPQLAAGSSDPFDLTNLRLDQSFVDSAGVKKLLTTVPVRRPSPQDFVRVHADPEYRAALAIIECLQNDLCRIPIIGASRGEQQRLASWQRLGKQMTLAL